MVTTFYQDRAGGGSLATKTVGTARGNWADRVRHSVTWISGTSPQVHIIFCRIKHVFI